MDLSRLIGADVRELVELLRVRTGRVDETWVDAVSALLVDRVVHLLRTAARDDVLAEAAALDTFLESAEGQALTENHPMSSRAWPGLAWVLRRAGTAADEPATESLLRSHGGKARQLIELLAESADPVPRVTARVQLGMSESHLSHMLRDLGEADLVVRRRASGREVLLLLGRRGRDVADRAVRPGWVDEVCALLAQLPDLPVDLDRRLRERGAPEPLVRRLTADLPPIRRSDALRLISSVTAANVRASEAYSDNRPLVSRLAASQ